MKGSIFAAARGLQVAATTREVLPALISAGIEHIVLKGPTIERVLYCNGPPRLYGDLDILVAAPSRVEAERSLAELGYRRGQFGWNEMSRSWRSPDPGFVDVDLHTSLVGAAADDLTVWSELSQSSEPVDLNGIATLALNRQAMAAHIATHAAQHGADPAPGPLEDLRRALEAFDMGVWADALAVARAISAEPAFGAGLRRLPAGADLARRLGVTEHVSIEVAARAADRYQPMVLGIEQIRLLEGPGARMRFVAKKAFPSAPQMRATSSMASRGRAGLAVAYLARLGSAVVHLPAALVRRGRMLSRDDA